MHRSAATSTEELDDLAAELASSEVDVIMALGTPPSVAAKKATTTIPIVSLSADPVWIGLVPSLARPGGNLTGITLISGPKMVTTHLELLTEVVLGLSRVGILRNPNNVTHAGKLKYLEAVAEVLNLQLYPVDAPGPADLDGAFASMVGQRPGALLVMGDNLFMKERARIAELAMGNRLPAVYLFKNHVVTGGMMSYSANFQDVFRKLARSVDRILKGAEPSELPMSYELAVNLSTAAKFGVSVPPAVLVRADEIIE